ncbi:MAG: hypothetical protein ACI4SN_03135 [Lachnospiraceae bacterium]|nr:hypothetical protein [Lachnospiraceae bacterium]
MQTKDKKHREKQKLLHFRFTQTGFMSDNRDGEYAEDAGRFVDVTLANRVENMLANADKPSERIIVGNNWEDLFGVL